MNFRNTLKSSAILALMVVGGMVTSEQPASAGCGFGDITCPPKKWTCPIGGCPPRPTPSCLSVMTDQKYQFTIKNTTPYTVAFTINQQSYRLESGYAQSFSFPKSYGTNSCNVQHYDFPTMTFDYSLSDGWQTQSYRIGDYGYYKFVQAGQNIAFQR